MLNYLNLFKKFFTKKWYFSCEKNIDLILLDNNFAKLKFKNLKYLNLNNKLYIFEFLTSLFKYILKLKFTKVKFVDYYFKNLIIKLNPKVALGHDIDEVIFKFKKFFPEKISIMYQKGFIFDHEKISIRKFKKLFPRKDMTEAIAYQMGYIFNQNFDSNSKKKFKKKEVDYYMVFDQRSVKLMSKHIKAKYLIAGSIKSNESNLEKKNKKYDLMFCSPYRKYNNKHFEKNTNHDKFAVKMIKKYCKKNKKKICIAFASRREDKIKYHFYNEELLFYEKNLSDFHNPDIDARQLASMSNVIISTISNLGYELFLSGKKVFFYNKKNYKYNFFKNKNSLVSYSGNSYKIFEKKLNYLLGINEKKYLVFYRKKMKDKYYDKGNNKLKKLIYKITKK